MSVICCHLGPCHLKCLFRDWFYRAMSFGIFSVFHTKLKIVCDISTTGASPDFGTSAHLTSGPVTLRFSFFLWPSLSEI